ncbi:MULTISPECIES: flagellar assembly protein FliW [Brevibacillus]|jgi:flagellar assembly factor FliW|nr:flagellar assembly protein FliW [Brevibacillus borstelensis]KKX54703.1 flagellar assembly protein FliW [Brevibacillus borstelensis cifa_chp40]MCM3590166.1 flagellar assembly protein FliW [Brevibacillus borstelensis]MED1745794.1 flagellar assembly protein FliW [Brevibacillus borstelensis]MED1881769.1 flagellar assembly protein FliW [Brevibacillus borstelensis]MED2007462.1 flagellar assembly protein FliW [Brevibacillus borstelensis]
MNANQQVELGKLFFEDGIPGFGDLQFFLLKQEEESPFFLIQSAEEEEVGFWVVNPFVFFPEYEFSLTEAAKTALSIEEDTPIGVFVIITVRENQVTANLKAPIVVNLGKRMARQVILQDDRYSIRQPLLEPRAAVTE